jgi:dCMP deaminase
MGLAQLVSTWSKDPSTKVGAVIADPMNRVVSLGYNGFPRGIEDTEERLSNRELKYKLVVHAEPNALLFAERSVKGCTIFTWPFMPCAQCAGKIIQSGIVTVVAPYSDNIRWADDFRLVSTMFKEAGVSLILYSERDDS